MALKYYNAAAADLSAIPNNSPIHLFHDYWLSIKPGDLLPGRQHLDPADIPRIVSWLFLVNVVRNEFGEPDFVYRLLGTSNVNLVGLDATGKRVTEAFEPVAARAIVRHYCQTVESGVPTFWTTDVPTEERRFIRCFRGIFPLAADGRSVDMLAGMLVPVGETVRV